MKKKTNKSSKLRTFTCGICGKEFQNRISPSEIELKIREGRIFCCSHECVKKNSSIKHSKGFFRKCEKCGKDFWVRLSYILKAKKNNTREPYLCSISCRKKDTNMEIGRYISYDGYYMIKTGKGYGGYEREHRVVAEKHYGKIPKGYIVHHVNDDKLDNRPENLMIVSRSEHNKIHKTFEKMFERRRQEDGLRKEDGRQARGKTL